MKKTNIAITILIIFSQIFLVPVAAVANEAFDPGLIISDERFGQVNAFSSADTVQRFLEERGSVLANTDQEFLKKLKEPVDVTLKQGLDDPNPSLGRLRTAAEIIYDAAEASQLNPQIILVTLQKEQSLITGSFSSDSVLQRRLDRALGYACPDSGTCGDLFLGFYFQLFGNFDNGGNRYLGALKSLSKSFYTEVNGQVVGRGPSVDSQNRAYGSAPRVRTARVGDTIEVENTQGPPYNAPATQMVTLKNSATAALYRYTPHVYNGNYNFWKFFNEWFRFTNGSLVRLQGSEQVFYIDNGNRRLVSGTVMTKRGLDITKAFTVTTSELNEFPIASPLPPPEGTIVAPASGGVFYLVSENELDPLSSFVAGLRGLSLANALYLPDNEVSTYAVGEKALPPEKTLVRSVSEQVVYYVEGGKLRPVSGFVFTQRGFKFANVVTGQDSEISSMPKGQTLPPLDGTLVKSSSSPLIYYVALGQKFPVPYFVFKARGFKFANVVALGNDELENMPTAEHLAPADGTLIKAKGDAAVFLVEAGSLHHISGFMFKHRGYKFADVLEVTAQELALIPTNSPLTLADGSLIQVTGYPTVYLLEEQSKYPLTLQAFNNRGFKFSDVITMPADEAARYMTGLPLTQ